MPLLSICIPTYNRSAALKASLEIMTSDPAFLSHDDIEIVISDNASPDDTEKICRVFAERFPQKVVYHRQPENKGYSANLETLSHLAKGEYFKFQNDNMLFRPGSLGVLRDFVNKYVDTKPVLFYADGFTATRDRGVVECRTYDDFLGIISHCSTWLGAYGFWRKDRDKVLELNRQFADSLIPQTAVIWYFFDQTKRAAVLQNRLYSGWAGAHIRKGGYNIAKVFSENYLSILKPYVVEGKISVAAYEYEKKKVFKNWTYPRYFDFLKKDNYVKGHFWSYTRDYHGNVYYWFSLALVPFYKFASMMPDSLRKYALSIYSPLRQSMIKRR